MAESLLRKVTLTELSKGIPAGYQLCRFRGDTLEEQYTGGLPSHVGADESLWLVPEGDVWLPAEFTAGETTAEAEVASNLTQRRAVARAGASHFNEAQDFLLPFGERLHGSINSRPVVSSAAWGVEGKVRWRGF